MESEEGEECEMGGGQSEVREWKVYGLSWEVLIFDDFSYDFSWEVLKITISTNHFMLCFECLTKKVSILWCVLRATVAKYCKIHMWFSEISDSMVQKHQVLSFPEEGDARTDGGIIGFELSPLARCMRIRCVQEWQRVIESGVRPMRREERQECETGRTGWGEKVKSVWF